MNLLSPIRPPSASSDKAAEPKKAARPKSRGRGPKKDEARCCFQLLKEGKCDVARDKGNRKYPHYNKAEYEEKRTEKEKEKAK